MRFARVTATESTMLDLSSDQRKLLLDKVPDVANVAAGALIFGQFLGPQRFSLVIAIVGAGVWSVLIGLMLFLGKKKRK